MILWKIYSKFIKYFAFFLSYIKVWDETEFIFLYYTYTGLGTIMLSGGEKFFLTYLL
jgi:hypothetical protein